MYVREGCEVSQQLKDIYMLTMRAAPPIRAPRATAAVGMEPACLEVSETTPEEAAAAALVALAISSLMLELWAALVAPASLVLKEASSELALEETLASLLLTAEALEEAAEAAEEAAPVAAVEAEATAEEARDSREEMAEERSPAMEEAAPSTEETTPVGTREVTSPTTLETEAEMS